MIAETEEASPPANIPATKAELAVLALKVRDAEEAAVKAAEKLNKAQSRMKRGFHAWEKAHSITRRVYVRVEDARRALQEAKRNRGS